MKQWIVYCTTCLSTQRRYVGVHYGETDSKYLGSGVHLKRAIAIYGRANFIRETLKICQDGDEAYELEELIVDEEMTNSPMFFNLAIGGRGAKDGLRAERSREKMRGPKTLAHRENIAKAKRGVPTTEKHKEACRAAQTGRKHSEATLLKMSETRSGKLHNLVTCPHCGKTGGAPAMGQWHFNNCKLRGNNYGD